MDEYRDEREEVQKAVVFYKSTEYDNEWSFEMEEGQVINQICISSEFIALFTNNDDVKVYTHGGSEILNFQSGNIITMSIFHHLLSIVTCNGMPFRGR